MEVIAQLVVAYKQRQFAPALRRSSERVNTRPHSLKEIEAGLIHCLSG